MKALLAVNSLKVTFGSRRRRATAVDDVTFEVMPGETVGLVGESGSGKSTIGRSILGLVAPAGGSISFAGQDLIVGWRRRRQHLAKQIQVIFQDPNSSLNPLMTVGQILEEPLRAVQHIHRSEAHRRTTDMLASVGLPEDAAARYPAEFSGGQRQRVAIARALVASPRLVVCDEPVSGLDLSTQAQVINLLSRLRAETNASYLFISHDLSVVRFLADRTVVLYRGRVMEIGPAETVAGRPLHPYTIALAAASPLLDVEAQREQRARRRQAMTLRRGIPAAVPGCPFSSRCPFMSDVCVMERPRLSQVRDAYVACHMYDPESGHPRAGQGPPTA
jgi:oligopeptide/dipeptide ABC transporter ATP-binding protein